MDLQTQFDITHRLLSNNAAKPYVADVLAAVSDPVQFDFIGEPADWNKTANILSLYELRYQIAKDVRYIEKIEDWERLLTSLRQTKTANVRICSITSAHRSFLLFSDFSDSELLGILNSDKGFVADQAEEENDENSV